MAQPIEAARPAVVDDRGIIEDLRTEARTAVAEARGGQLLTAHDRPLGQGSDVLAAALGGAGDVAAFVGLLDDVVAGYLLVQVEPVTDGDPVAVVTELFVSPWARELGVGEQLLDLTFAWARERRCSGVDAEALPGDRATKNFFESHGLVARAILVHRRFDDEPADLG